MVNFCFHLQKSRYNTHITCAVYNYLGDEILASFSNDVFLFDTKRNGLGEHKHVYSGHRLVKSICSQWLAHIKPELFLGTTRQ